LRSNSSQQSNCKLWPPIPTEIGGNVGELVEILTIYVNTFDARIRTKNIFEYISSIHSNIFDICERKYDLMGTEDFGTSIQQILIKSFINYDRNHQTVNFGKTFR